VGGLVEFVGDRAQSLHFFFGGFEYLSLQNSIIILIKLFAGQGQNFGSVPKGGLGAGTG
jgi:hypothetical protein